MFSPVSPKFKTEWPAILVLVITAVVGIYFFNHFPAQVPTHWNINGEADGYSAPAFAAFFFPAFMTVMYLVLLFLPYLDPRRDRYNEFSGAYHLIKNGMVIFMFLIFIMTGLAGLGYQVDISFWMPIMIGALFVGLGFVMGKIKTNWFIGIRTPWTLSSETVWAKTHQAASWVMTLAGIILAATIFFTSSRIKVFLLFTSIIIMAIGLPVYSYWLYRQEKNK